MTKRKTLVTKNAGLELREDAICRIYVSGKGKRREAFNYIGIEEGTGREVIVTGGNLIYASLFDTYEKAEEAVKKLESKECSKGLGFDIEIVERIYIWIHQDSGMAVTHTSNRNNINEIENILSEARWDIKFSPGEDLEKAKDCARRAKKLDN